MINYLDLTAPAKESTPVAEVVSQLPLGTRQDARATVSNASDTVVRYDVGCGELLPIPGLPWGPGGGKGGK